MYIFSQEMELLLRFSDLLCRICVSRTSPSTWTSHRKYCMDPPNVEPEKRRRVLSWQVHLDFEESMVYPASRVLLLLGDSEPEAPKKPELFSANWRRAGSPRHLARPSEPRKIAS